jgi:phytanoyl-CoA dioxygenase PhyH
MIQIFKDVTAQKEFEEKGYVKISLLGREEIDALTQYYLRMTGGNVKNSIYGMYVSLHDEDNIRIKRETMEEIRKIVLPRLSDHFHNCKHHLGSFLVKVPNPSSYTFPHQDWTFVDNEKMSEYCSLTVWITLKDLDVQSGTLGLIKGSPHFFSNVIGSPSPAIKTTTQGHEPMLFEYLSFPKVKAGDALAFNNKCIHAALPNTSQQQRIALGIGVTPRDATIYHYFLKPGTTDRLLKLRAEEEFFVRYSNQALFNLYREGKVPGYCKVEGELEYNFKPISAAGIEQLCIKHGSTRNGMAVSLTR